MKKAGYLAVFWLIFSQAAFSQWPTSPDQRLVLGYGTTTKIVSDGNGGAFVVFKSYNGVSESHCYLRQVNQYGYPLSQTALYLNSGNGQLVFDFQAVSDGEGGVIVGVMELCNPNWTCELSVYRFDSAGNTIYWDISPNTTGEIATQDYFIAATDSAGGCYLAYGDIDFIRVQHLGTSGERLWGESGIPLDVGIAYPMPYDLRIVANQDHCFVTVRGDALYAFKFTNDGQAVWGESGIVIPDIGYNPKLVCDGVGGLVQACQFYTFPDQYQLRVFRLDENGNWVWSQNGVSLGEVVIGQYQVLCHEDAIFTSWLSADLPHASKLQKLDLQGNVLWPADLNLCPGSGNQGGLVMTDANNTGLVFALSQVDNGYTANLYTVKYGYSGENLWDDSVVALTNRGYEAGSLNLDNNASGGGIYTWYEIDPVYGQVICAGMVNSLGELGQVLAVEHGLKPSLPANGKLCVFPNPANSQSKLYLMQTLPPNSVVNLCLVNLQGQLVAQKELKSPGNYIPLDFLNRGGLTLTSGIYLVQVSYGYESWSTQLIYLK